MCEKVLKPPEGILRNDRELFSNCVFYRNEPFVSHWCDEIDLLSHRPFLYAILPMEPEGKDRIGEINAIGSFINKFLLQQNVLYSCNV